MVLVLFILSKYFTINVRYVLKPFQVRFILLTTIAFTLTDDENSYEDYEYSVTLEIYQLNGEIVQTLKTPKHKRLYSPVFSQSGEFMMIPTVVSFKTSYE